MSNIDNIAYIKNDTGYRRDIDGLRAISIIPVILFHAFPSSISGGYVGVDIFFVISGYLISGIIFEQASEKRLSLYNFYARRLRRILPGLLVVLITTGILGWFVLLPDEYRTLGKHITGGAVYISNFVLRSEINYFDISAENKPLLHLWSLAIEEQFYIFWPFIVIFLLKRVNPRNNVLFYTIIATVLISFVYCSFRVQTNQTATFYLPLTRIWELLIGATVAYRQTFSRKPVTGDSAPAGSLTADLRSIVGSIMIAGSMVLLDRSTLYPGWQAAFPTLGAAIVISAGPTAIVNRTLLSSRILVFTGLISYALYLWHWPLLSLAHVIGVTSWISRLSLLGLAVLLSVATWRLERFIRFGGLSKISPRATVFAGLGFCLCVAGIGQAIQRGVIKAYSDRFGVDRILVAAGEWDYPGDMKPVSFNGRKIWQKPGAGGAVLFVGDSNMEQYAPRVLAKLNQSPQSFKSAFFLTGGGCPPILGVSDPAHPNCTGLIETALDFAQQRNVDTIVLAAQWWGYFSPAGYQINGRKLSDPTAAQDALRSLADTIHGFSAGGTRKVFVVLNIPFGPQLDPRQLVERTAITFKILEGGIPLAQLTDAYGDLSKKIIAAVTEAGATVIDPLPYLCGPQMCPAVTTDGDPIYKDAGHLRPSYVRQNIDFLDPAFSRN